MRIFPLLAVAFGLFGAQTAQALPSGVLYIDDIAGNVGTVNLSSGAVQVLGNAGVVLTDIAFTSSGALYGTSFDSLYQLNQTSGSATLVGNYNSAGAGGMNGLVGIGAGLYGTSNSTTSLYSIDVAPFKVTELAGSTGGNSAGDLAAFSANIVYSTLVDGTLVRLDVSAGTVTSTVIGNTGRGDVYGLARGDDNTLYAVAGTDVYTVNTATAALTPFISYAGSGLGIAYGTAFMAEATPVPEPMSIALLGLGVIGAGSLRRRMS